MGLSGKDWLSLDTSTVGFEKTLVVLVSHFARELDTVVFERTFGGKDSIKQLELQEDENEDYLPLFYSGTDLYYGKVTEAFLNSFCVESRKQWIESGFENFSLYRDGKCYLETIDHHDMIFIRAERFILKQIGIDCEAFEVKA